MKYTRNILLISLILIISASAVDSQVLLRNDKKNAKIVNNGTFRVLKTGSIVGMPDTIGGRVEFISDERTMTQAVPNSTYNQLLITGSTKKYIDSAWNHKTFNPLRTRDSLIVDGETEFNLDSVEVHAQGPIANEARIKGRNDLRAINEVNSQTIQGKGLIRRLNIDNPQGVDVVKGGGFKITGKLELTRGELRNDADNNFHIEDSVRIIRHTGASLANDPEFDGRDIAVEYVGGGSLSTGPELPNDSTLLASLYNKTSGGVYLTKSVTVNDSLLLVSDITTSPNSTTFNDDIVLTYTNDKSPIFTNHEAEIIGAFRRTKISFDSTRVIFNNPYTWALFLKPEDANGSSDITFRVKPKTFPPFYKGELKVRRSFEIRAMDSNYASIEEGINMKVGYGWRVSKDTAKDENHGMPLPELLFQRWTGSDWFDYDNSKKPILDTLPEWAYASADISQYGDFAIGLPGGIQLTLDSRVLLEGPYRYGSMAQDLRLKNLVPKTPPDIYPYNLDPNRNLIFVNQIPDSVVDWIVMEFRPSFTSTDRFYRTAFLRFDGRVVDLDGISPVLLSKGGIDSGEYYVAIHHRNHLAVITEKKVGIYPETVQRVLDFTNPNILMGRFSALKPIDVTEEGRAIFGMIGGDINGDGIVDENDMIGVWSDRDYEGQYLNTDTRMNGIIHTRDFNVSWNNRGRVSNLPK